MTSYTNQAGTVEMPVDVNLFFTKPALDLYQHFNPERFDENRVLPNVFFNAVNVICNAHEQPYVNEFEPFPDTMRTVHENNKTLSACSGGLDSVYQAISLRQKGYDVTLFHVKNMNFYANGKEALVVEELAKKLGFPLVEANFKANVKKDNPYRKFWSENSFKDMLFYSMMLDYAYEEGIYNLSSGDDFGLDISKAVVGTNLSDAKQVTEAFIKDVSKYQEFEFIPTPQIHKGERLKTLETNGLLDDFYSCVNPGRFNKLNHDRVQAKFDVNLYKYNCGMCRKCAFHNLLRHYYMNEPFNQAFIDHCWERITVGADRVFFDTRLPLEERIKNLYEY